MKSVGANEVVEVTEELIAAWKKEHKRIFCSTVDGENYYWRKIKRQEYVGLMMDREEELEESDRRIFDRQEQIASLVVIHPANIAELIQENAGLATTLADECIMRSGFGLTNTKEL